MSYDPSNSPSQTGYATGSAIDTGLQSYMRSVYNTMSLGLVVTGLTAFGVASTPALFNLIFHSPLGFIVMLAPLAFIWFGFTPARVAAMPSEKLKFIFVLFSATMGLSLAAIFIVYTGASIARVFFITAGTFAATSLYGYTTKRDLTGLGSFMMMGLTGIFIAMLVIFIFHSAMVQFVVSVLGVVIFTGLTAWETQALKNTYNAGADESNAKLAIVGALNLYMSFINLFQFLLSFFGDRR